MNNPDDKISEGLEKSACEKVSCDSNLALFAILGVQLFAGEKKKLNFKLC